MMTGRFSDDLGNTWIVSDHESAVCVVIVAIAMTEASREVDATSDLMAEMWATKMRSEVAALQPLKASVRAYSSPDAVGVILQAPRQHGSMLVTLIQSLLRRASLTECALDRVRIDAIEAVHTRSSEITSLAVWSLPNHRYSLSVSDRISAIRQSGWPAYREVLAQKKFIVAVGCNLTDDGSLRPLNRGAVVPESFALRKLDGDRISRTRSEHAKLAQVAISTPGVPMRSSAKANLHVFWALMREREGVFYPLARARGSLIYSVAAFSREYYDGGFGMCVFSCDQSRVAQITEIVREASGRIASGATSSGTLQTACALIASARDLTMRNAEATGKVLLASALSGLASDHYDTQLQSLSREELAETADTVVHKPGWWIRETLPSDPESNTRVISGF